MTQALIKSPVPDGHITVSGTVAYLRFGSHQRFKVLLQDEPAYLLDYRTGMRIPSSLGSGEATLHAEATYIMATRSPNHKHDPRTCAQLRLDMLVERKPEAELFAVVDAAPTLNED